MAKIENHTPVSIPVFRDKEMLDEVRITTINPLANEVTKLSNLMSSACGSINSLDTKVTNLNAKVDRELVNGGVDLGPIHASITKNTEDIQILKYVSVDLRQDMEYLDDKINSSDTAVISARVDKVESDISANNSSISALQKETSDLLEDVIELEKVIPIVNKTVVDISNVEDQQDVISTDIRNVKTSLEAFGNSLVTVESSVRDSAELVRLNDLAVKASEAEVRRVEALVNTNKAEIDNSKEAISNVERGVMDNTQLINSKDLAIKANAEAIAKTVRDIDILDMHVSDLQALVNAGAGSGGGTGGTVDLSGIIKDIADNKASIEDLKDEVDINTADIAALKVPTPSDKVSPTKFYVLPILGQSNAVGYGELGYELKGCDDVHPRIKQLGRYGGTATGTNTVNNVNKARTKYGDRWDELRPFPDCNLKIIPAVPCLDHIQNMFQHQIGGTVGFGMYLAKMLLPYIPEDYGILIVPCARGSSAFSGSATGTYDAARMFCSENATKQGVGTPLGNANYDRVKFALNENADNRLLPVIWVQGEMDQGKSEQHLSGFEAYFNWYKDKLVTDGLASKILGGDISYFRWLCVGGTKWVLGANLQGNYLTDAINFEGGFGRLSVYDNYCYLSNKYRTANGSSPIVYVRADINSHGTFVETNREKGNGITTATREIHFSTHANQVQLPKILFNAICGYTPALTMPTSSKDSRYVRGGGGMIITDNVTFQYEKPATDFNLATNLLVHQKWPTISAGKLTNQVAGGIALTGATSCTVVADAKFGAVLRFNDTAGGQIDMLPNKGSTSFTKSIVFKPASANRLENSNIMSTGSGGNDTDGISWYMNGSLYIAPDYNSSQRANNFAINPCLVGGWNGQFNDWQHLVMSYNKSANLFSVYLNGALVSQTKATTPTLKSVCVGGYKSGDFRFEGDVANYRIYDRCLSHGEIGTLWHCDMKNYL